MKGVYKTPAVWSNIKNRCKNGHLHIKILGYNQTDTLTESTLYVLDYVKPEEMKCSKQDVESIRQSEQAGVHSSQVK